MNGLALAVAILRKSQESLSVKTVSFIHKIIQIIIRNKKININQTLFNHNETGRKESFQPEDVPEESVEKVAGKAKGLKTFSKEESTQAKEKHNVKSVRIGSYSGPYSVLYVGKYGPE